MKPLAIISVSVISVAVLALLAGTAHAKTTLTDDQRLKVQANCQSVKSVLNQLKVSDALLRVNRGQLYESIATKLMDPFNNRLSTNSITNSTLTTTTSAYRQTLANFRNDYIAYADSLIVTIAIDCQSRPDDFHNSLESTRSLRIKVHDDVVKINSLITEYQTGVNAFLTSYQQAVSGVAP